MFSMCLFNNCSIYINILQMHLHRPPVFNTYELITDYSLGPLLITKNIWKYLKLFQRTTSPFLDEDFWYSMYHFTYAGQNSIY